MQRIRRGDPLISDGFRHGPKIESFNCQVNILLARNGQLELRLKTLCIEF